MKRRVVITGLGVVSSIGIGKDEFWKNLIAGKSGISDVTLFDTSDYPVHKGGEVKNFDPTKFIPKNRIKDIARASQFAIAATKLALDDSGLSLKNIKNRIGIILGTTMADIQSLEQVDKYWSFKGEEDIWAVNIVKYPSMILSGQVGYFFQTTSQNYVIPTACAAGNYSIGYSFDLIRRGIADAVIAGGADPFSRITFSGFNCLYVMAPEKCQPFDRNRKGMMIGEGAGVLILEELELAKKRNAPIYAEVLGYGLSCDAKHMTAPRAEGIVKVMERAIKNSGIRKEEVDYISAHGTGTLSNDKAECEAIKRVFEDSLEKICTSSIKSMLGHTMGAASAIEAIACCLALKNNIVPPTINYEAMDEECDIDCVPNKAKTKNLEVVINNSFAFGGNNACLVVKKYGKK